MHPEAEGEIQNRVADWIKARRREASDMALRLLPESAADWKAASRGTQRRRHRELPGSTGGRRPASKAAGTMNETLAGRIGGAIIALCPKAAFAGDDSA